MGIAELTGDEDSDARSRTFIFEGEGHTLGNALQSIISKYPETRFCGYTIPHPAEKNINFRIQTSGPKAIDLLRRGLLDLMKQCSAISKTFEEALLHYNQLNQTGLSTSSVHNHLKTVHDKLTEKKSSDASPSSQKSTQPCIFNFVKRTSIKEIVSKLAALDGLSISSITNGSFT